MTMTPLISSLSNSELINEALNHSDDPAVLLFAERLQNVYSEMDSVVSDCDHKELVNERLEDEAWAHAKTIVNLEEENIKLKEQLLAEIIEEPDQSSGSYFDCPNPN